MIFIFHKRFKKSTAVVTNDHQGAIEKLGVKWSSWQSTTC